MRRLALTMEDVVLVVGALNALGGVGQEISLGALRRLAKGQGP
jgi:hypothetical protein